jgi:glutathione S-transferase
MQLIGYMDSPFVRRVAISLEMLGVAYDHRELSIFRDFDEFHSINPLVKVPTLVLDSGQVLVDSSLIIDYLEKQIATRSLMPVDSAAYLDALQHIGIGLVAMEKVASLIYETSQRPQERQHPAWIDRLQTQLKGAVGLMESAVSNRASDGNRWLCGQEPGQADITTAVAWRFTQHVEKADIPPNDYPALVAYSERAEKLQEFLACPLSG